MTFGVEQDLHPVSFFLNIFDLEFPYLVYSFLRKYFSSDSIFLLDCRPCIIYPASIIIVGTFESIGITSVFMVYICVFLVRSKDVDGDALVCVLSSLSVMSVLDNCKDKRA